MVHRIDLGEYRTPGTRVFAGRKRGAEVRKLAGLERLEAEGQQVVFLVPSDVISINTSFWLGLVGDSIRRLGESRFRELFALESDAHADVYENGVREALRFSNPLERPAQGPRG